MEKDRDGCPKIVNLGSAKTDLFYERKKVSYLHLLQNNSLFCLIFQPVNSHIDALLFSLILLSS
jgi:hypothetical protein